MSKLSMAHNKRDSASKSRLLLNPFYYVAGGKALAIGVIVMLTTGCLAFLGKIRFDGLIDFHFGGTTVPLWLNVSELLVSWILMSVFILFFGRIISKSRIRFIDVFGTQALARAPYLFLALAALLLPGAHRSSQKLLQTLLSDQLAFPAFSFDMVAFFFLLLFAFLMTIWMILLMYRAFSVSCNVSGKSAISLFIVALVIVEFLSMFAIRFGLQSVTAQPTDLSSPAAEFVTLLSDGDYESAVNMFDESMTSIMPEEKLEKVWQSLLAQFGPYRAQTAAQGTKASGYDVFLIPCRFEKASINARITFNAYGEIAGLYFFPPDADK